MKYTLIHSFIHSFIHLFIHSFNSFGCNDDSRSCYHFNLSLFTSVFLSDFLFYFRIIYFRIFCSLNSCFFNKMTKRNKNGDIKKYANTHAHIHAYKEIKIWRTEMVALGHHSGFGLYWDSIPSPVLCIKFSEQPRQNEINTQQLNARCTYILLN